MLTILELANNFGFTHYVSSPTAIKREVKNDDIDRCGVELMGHFTYHDKDRLVLIGNKEWAIIEDLSDEDCYERFKKICNDECPGIIICQSRPCPPMLEKAAREMDCPVFGTSMRTSDLMSDIIIYLSDKLAQTTSIHACLLDIFNVGVLLMGESGIGKSEISMDLVKKGHQLVADDMVKISLVRDHLVGRAPESISGMMEVRGIGIVNVSHIFGINSVKKKDSINLAIELKPFTKNFRVDRLGMMTDFIDILGVKIPKIILPVSAARNICEIIEVAVTNFKLKESGYDSSYEFEKRLIEIQESKKSKR
ncbi:MAG TPA: HPr(Ser) kinase/phosphatase [Firmicutes bacterium]|nr:HPr(Ser) kinase/phosphatase [Bacillota bacterium]